MTNYDLDPNKKPFSYTREELFETITRIVAHPHTAITQHDKARAAAIFMVFGDYLGNYTQGQEDCGHYIHECDEIDFEEFVMKLLGIEEYGETTATELLK